MATAPYTGIRWSMVVLFSCLMIMVVGVPIEYILFPNWNWEIPSGINFLWLSSWGVIGAVGSLAIDAFLRAHTRIIMTTEGSFTLAYWAPKTLVSRHYRLDREAIKQVMRVNGYFDRAGNLKPGLTMPENASANMDSQGRDIKLIALMLGGIDYGGIHFKGHDGILLVEGGEEEFIRFGIAHKGISVVLPRLLVRMRHEQIDPEVMNQLQLIDGFQERKTPVFRATVYDPGFIDYIKSHADHFKPIIDGVNMANTNPKMDQTSLWIENMEKQAEITGLKLEVKNLQGANRAYSDIVNGRALQAARGYQRSAGMDPNLRQSRETPLEPPQG